MKWVIKEPDYFEPYLMMKQQEYKQIGVGPTMARILMARNYDFEDIKKVLREPSSCLEAPEEIFGCTKAAKKIVKLINENYKIKIFADYDVDGLTAGFIMSTYLSWIGAAVDVYYPERKEGYGLSLKFVKELKDKEAVVTVDNGITAFEAIKYCNDQSIPLVITDHHEPVKKINKVVVCDPFLGDKGRHLCGAAVAWKVCQVIDKILNKNLAWQLTPYAAIGTVADVMPMTMENMVIVKTGLKMIEEGFAPNIMKFFSTLNIRKITADDVGWILGPRLNSCGRMGNVKLAAQFLFTDYNNQSAVDDILLKINGVNSQRKKVLEEVMISAMKQDYSREAFCFYDITGYPFGISGLVAGKLVEAFGKPAIVYSRNKNNLWPGSVRSVEGFDILPHLARLQDKGVIVSYGGHAQACGVTLNPDLEAFRHMLNGSIMKPLQDHMKQESTIGIDIEISLSEVNDALYNELIILPTDKEVFPKPTFIVRDLEVCEVVPSRNNPNHIRFSFVDKDKFYHTYWGWNMGEVYKNLKRPKRVDIIGTIGLDTYNKKTPRPTFVIGGIRNAGTN